MSSEEFHAQDMPEKNDEFSTLDSSPNIEESHIPLGSQDSHVVESDGNLEPSPIEMGNHQEIHSAKSVDSVYSDNLSEIVNNSYSPGPIQPDEDNLSGKAKEMLTEAHEKLAETIVENVIDMVFKNLAEKNTESEASTPQEQQEQILKEEKQFFDELNSEEESSIKGENMNADSPKLDFSYINDQEQKLMPSDVLVETSVELDTTEDRIVENILFPENEGAEPNLASDVNVIKFASEHCSAPSVEAVLEFEDNSETYASVIPANREAVIHNSVIHQVDHIMEGMSEISDTFVGATNGSDQDDHSFFASNQTPEFQDIERFEQDDAAEKNSDSDGQHIQYMGIEIPGDFNVANSNVDDSGIVTDARAQLMTENGQPMDLQHAKCSIDEDQELAVDSQAQEPAMFEPRSNDESKDELSTSLVTGDYTKPDMKLLTENVEQLTEMPTEVLTPESICDESNNTTESLQSQHKFGVEGGEEYVASIKQLPVSEIPGGFPVREDESFIREFETKATPIITPAVCVFNLVEDYENENTSVTPGGLENRLQPDKDSEVPERSTQQSFAEECYTVDIAEDATEHDNMFDQETVTENISPVNEFYQEKPSCPDVHEPDILFERTILPSFEDGSLTNIETGLSENIATGAENIDINHRNIQSRETLVVSEHVQDDIAESSVPFEMKTVVEQVTINQAAPNNITQSLIVMLITDQVLSAKESDGEVNDISVEECDEISKEGSHEFSSTIKTASTTIPKTIYEPSALNNTEKHPYQYNIDEHQTFPVEDLKPWEEIHEQVINADSETVPHEPYGQIPNFVNEDDKENVLSGHKSRSPKRFPFQDVKQKSQTLDARRRDEFDYSYIDSKRRAATLGRSTSRKRQRLFPKPTPNDDHLYPDSVTPSKVDRDLSKRSLSEGLPEGTYDVPFIDDDAFLPKHMRDVSPLQGDTGEGSECSSEGIDWYWQPPTYYKVTMEASHLADTDECLTTPKNVPKLQSSNQGERHLIEERRTGKGMKKKRGLGLCSCVGKRRKK